MAVAYVDAKGRITNMLIGTENKFSVVVRQSSELHKFATLQVWHYSYID